MSVVGPLLRTRWRTLYGKILLFSGGFQGACSSVFPSLKRCFTWLVVLLLTTSFPRDGLCEHPPGLNVSPVIQFLWNFFHAVSSRLLSQCCTCLCFASSLGLWVCLKIITDITACRWGIFSSLRVFTVLHFFKLHVHPAAGTETILRTRVKIHHRNRWETQLKKFNFLWIWEHTL